MRIAADCVPCLLNRVLFETELVDPALKDEAMAIAVKILAERFRPGVNSAAVATKVHRAVYDAIGSEDPYSELKERANQIARSLYPRAESFVASSTDRLEAACLMSIIGNVLDFGLGIGYDEPEDLSREFDALVAQGLGVNDCARMKELLVKGGSVVYLMDNCGEIVFDRLLVNELKRLGVRVVGVVKGAPILTDVTEADLMSTGMDKVFDAWLSTGSFAIGIDTTLIGQPLLDELERADLIISKGMANFESLSDRTYPRVAYLMRTKCRPVADAIGAGEDQNVVKLCISQQIKEAVDKGRF
jgi:damage-control phosphatase, subfamily I